MRHRNRDKGSMASLKNNLEIEQSVNRVKPYERRIRSKTCIIAAVTTFFFLVYLAPPDIKTWFSNMEHGTSSSAITITDSSTNNITATAKDHSSSDVKKKISVRLVSMNVAMAEPSEVAPSDWNNQHQESALRKEILSTNPDVIMLQECPSLQWAKRIFQNNSYNTMEDGDGDGQRGKGKGQGYVAVGSKAAHAGYVVLLLRQNLYQNSQRLTNLPHGLPAVASQIKFGSNDNNNAAMVLASCHLAPFEGASIRRQQQMEDLLEAVVDKIPIMIVAGDTNMRDSEDNYMKNDLKLLDIWKRAGSNSDTKYTWDTIDHTTNNTASKSLFYNEYYGRNTRQYQRRYDRVYAYLGGGGKRSSAQSFNLIANKPIPPSNNHFLSDHFGIATEVEFQFD